MESKARNGQWFACGYMEELGLRASSSVSLTLLFHSMVFKAMCLNCTTTIEWKGLILLYLHQFPCLRNSD